MRIRVDVVVWRGAIAESRHRVHVALCAAGDATGVAGMESGAPANDGVASDVVTTFRVNKQSGALTFTGQYTPVGTPANVVFLT